MINYIPDWQESKEQYEYNFFFLVKEYGNDVNNYLMTNSIASLGLSTVFYYNCEL